MSALRILSIMALIGLGACTHYEWTPTAPDGTQLSAAQTECSTLARENVRKYRPFNQRYYAGAADFPFDSPRDMEKRETELCLADKGFRKVAVD